MTTTTYAGWKRSGYNANVLANKAIRCTVYFSFHAQGWRFAHGWFTSDTYPTEAEAVAAAERYTQEQEESNS